jgi:hypothetical protein
MSASYAVTLVIGWAQAESRCGIIPTLKGPAGFMSEMSRRLIDF